MKILYIFPHPDDESFGVAHAMYNQRRHGHHVHLLTLTKGEATKQRFRFNYSLEEMGKIRYREMQNVSKVLDLSGMTVLDLPDGQLKYMDPREIENMIKSEILKIEPSVIVTYPVHGISGFHDHLVTHAVVKRTFVELEEQVAWLKRLAFLTLTEEDAAKGRLFKLNGSTSDEIDCVLSVEDVDIKKCHEALDCYVTFTSVIEKSKIKNAITHKVVFEFFNEHYSPPLNDLFVYPEDVQC